MIILKIQKNHELKTLVSHKLDHFMKLFLDF